MADTFKLTYFNTKGIAEPIRLMFAYSGVKYEDIRIEKEQWPNVKADEKCVSDYPFGQLPVLQVGDKTLSQSITIARYLAKRFNLAGKGDWESAKIDEYVDALRDLRMECKKMMSEQDETQKDELKKTVFQTVMPKYLSNFEYQLSTEEGPFMVGKDISWLDISLAHWLQLAEAASPGLLDQYPGLKNLVSVVFENANIKEWVTKRPVTEN